MAKKGVRFTGGLRRLWSAPNQAWVLLWGSRERGTVLRIGEAGDLDRYTKWELGARRRK